MESREVKQHWEGWAKEHGTSVRATTVGETAKRLEIEALYRQMRGMPAGTRVLEAGCGNGINCIELEKRLSCFTFHGFDYVQQMISAAIDAAAEVGIEANTKDSPLHFGVGDVLDIDDILWLDREYDVVVTDRCLINLNSFEKQKEAVAILASKVRSGGRLLMIENLVEGRKNQNHLREALGLKSRQLMPPFNRFFTVDEIAECISSAGLTWVPYAKHLSSLHDLMLYVMVPALQGKSTPDWDYDHPLVKIATELCIRSPGSNFGAYGQNVLFICRKP